jgi:hypothetical protein
MRRPRETSSLHPNQFPSRRDKPVGDAALPLAGRNAMMRAMAFGGGVAVLPPVHHRIFAGDFYSGGHSGHESVTILRMS